MRLECKWLSCSSAIGELAHDLQGLVAVHPAPILQLWVKVVRPPQGHTAAASAADYKHQHHCTCFVTESLSPCVAEWRRL